MFSFTFSVGSGIFNPFAAQAEERERRQEAIAPQTVIRKLPAPPQRHIPPTPVNEISALSRKRGWAPSTSSPSAPVSQYAQTNGWLDTPSRYIEAASLSQQNSRGDPDFDDAGKSTWISVKEIFWVRDGLCRVAFTLHRSVKRLLPRSHIRRDDLDILLIMFIFL